MDRPPALPPRLEEVLARLNQARLRVYLVGGALRDALLGRPVRDFDLLAEAELARVRRVLPEARTVAASTPVLLLGGAEPRIEISSLADGARTLELNLRRRDFTINAIAFDPRAARYIDPAGGRNDLAARCLRAVDPSRVFQDDPARVLRGVRLRLALDFQLDAETENAMARDAWRLARVACERLREELFRILALEPPSRGLRDLHQLGALPALLPELLREIGVEQNAHHPDDVFTHTLKVCDGVGPDPLLRLAALLHDASKPETKVYSATRRTFTFHRHELLGARRVDAVAERLRLSGHEHDVVTRLVRNHLLFPDRLRTDAAIRRMVRRAGSDILPALLELRRADLASRGNPDEHWMRLEARIHQLEQATTLAPRLAISGKDIMRELEIEEGRAVGRWLQRAWRRVTERPEENERERLLAWLRASAESE